MLKAYTDLAGQGFDEDERIEKIGDIVLSKRITAGLVVDDTVGTPDRYKRKLEEKFPGILVAFIGKGPLQGQYELKVSPPVHSEN